MNNDETLKFDPEFADKTADSLVKRSVGLGAEIQSNPLTDPDEKFRMHIKQQNILLDKLSEVSFDDETCSSFIESMNDFKKIYDRFLYSEITGYCHEKEELETLVSNTKKVYLYCKSNVEAEDRGRVEKILLKLYDHVSLVDKQKARSKMLREGMDKRISEQKTTLQQIEANISREEKQLERFQEKLSSMKSDLIGQLISLVAMFIAVAFVVFGGISSLNSISSLLKAIVEAGNTSINNMGMIYKSFTLWGLGMFNVLFLFMHFISKLADKKFSFFQFDEQWCGLAKFLCQYGLFFLINIVGLTLIIRVL
ncbi:hypothetical protein [Aedoeadaptatus coxii]|uniref:hypothetical protein n=1 Tax=Aedoeadaptatus coxii TaxID=755172 RepID=UPI002AD2FDA2|nr:hypothetical protein [Peptoniphilus coxii]